MSDDVLSTLYTEPWWMTYDDKSRDILQNCAETIAAKLVTEWESKMAIGKALAEAQRILEPHNHFTSFCKTFHFSIRTAYKRIARWKIAVANLPDVILQEAVATGMDIVGESEEQPFGPYTEAVKVIPMPRRPTPESARNWLGKVEQQRRSMKESPPIRAGNEPLSFPPVNREEILKSEYIQLRKGLRKLGTKQDVSFILSQLIGMALTEFDLKAESIKVAPVKVPADFMPQRGRPKPAITARAS